MNLYKCEHCGNIIGMVHDSGVPVVCCGRRPALSDFNEQRDGDQFPYVGGNEEGSVAKTLPRPQLLAVEADTTSEEQLGAERDALIARGVLSAEGSADFRRASLAVKHAILAAAKLKERVGNVWRPEEITIIGSGGDGTRYSNPAYWQDYITHGSRRGRGTLFVDTLASIPLCEVAIALQLHGAAGYLAGLSIEALLRTSQTPYTLVLSATSGHAEAWLYRG